MTSSGVFPKVNGDALDYYDTSILRNYGYIEDIKTRMIMQKQGYEGFSKEYFVDGFYDALRSATLTNLNYISDLKYYYSTSSSAVYESKTHSGLSDNIIVPYIDYEIIPLYDTFPGSSLSATTWTSATGGAGAPTITVTGDYCQIARTSSNNTGFGYITSNGSSGFDFYANGNYLRVVCSYEMVTGFATYSHSIQLTDGTNTVTLLTASGTQASRSSIIEVDKNKKIARANNGAWTDISSIVTNCYLRFRIDYSGGLATFRVYDVYISNTYSSSVVIAGSYNGGSNYETLTNEKYNTMTTAGTNKRLKLTYTQSGSDMLLIRGVGFFINK